MQFLLSAVLLLSALSVPMAPPVSAAPAPPPISYQEHVVSRLTNSAGDEVVYRRGYWFRENSGGGFGYDKVFHKHNITAIYPVSFVVRSPRVVREESPGVWVHERQFCQTGNGHAYCVNSDRVTIRVVISYNGWTGPGQHGVKTAYCIGMIRCPDWVSFQALPT